MTSDEDLMIQRLDTIVSLLALGLTRGLPREEAILALRQVGLSVSEIARLLGLSANAVSVAAYRVKRKKRKG